MVHILRFFPSREGIIDLKTNRPETLTELRDALKSSATIRGTAADAVLAHLEKKLTEATHTAHREVEGQHMIEAGLSVFIRLKEPLPLPDKAEFESELGKSYETCVWKAHQAIADLLGGVYENDSVKLDEYTADTKEGLAEELELDSSPAMEKMAEKLLEVRTYFARFRTEARKLGYTQKDQAYDRILFNTVLNTIKLRQSTEAHRGAQAQVDVELSVGSRFARVSRRTAQRYNITENI